MIISPFPEHLEGKGLDIEEAFNISFPFLHRFEITSVTTGKM